MGNLYSGNSIEIKKIDNDKIQCTINKEVFNNRKMKISELAYGTANAKALFRDIMQEAFLKFGFQAKDTTLMLEAVPVDKKTITLIISKVKDKNELDTRFSNFVPIE